MSDSLSSEHQLSQLSLALDVDESFDYVIKRQRRKTMAVHVLADASVEVRIPKWLPKYEVVKFIEQRSSWIIEQRHKNLQRQHLIPGYFHGQKHYFLGKSFPLSVIQKNKNSIQFIQLDNSTDDFQGWLVGLRDPDNCEGIRKLLEQWYRIEAQKIFEQQMQHCFSLFPDWFQQRYSIPVITIRKMRRRWGSCSSKGSVTLNLLLMKFPMRCIDYVIIHELCHLQEFHHGKRFYQLLASIMPDWKEVENLIESLSSGE